MNENQRSKIYKLLLNHIKHHIGKGRGTATVDEDAGVIRGITYCTPEEKLAMKLPALGTIVETTAFADRMIDQLIIIEDAIESIESHTDKRK